MDRLVQRAAPASGARVSQPAPVSGATSSTCGLTAGEHYMDSFGRARIDLLRLRWGRERSPRSVGMRAPSDASQFLPTGRGSRAGATTVQSGSGIPRAVL